jgi:hypothetical protein
MADTLDQIYMNTALGGTELDDGEHTLLTTDANTSYVIKDMFVSNTTHLTADSRLELNGFDVGSVKSNATGSLIVPPSSTLKVKSSTYPYIYEEITTLVFKSNKPIYEKSVRQAGTTGVGTVVTQVIAANAFTSTPANALKVNYNVADDGVGWFYMEISDNNSAQGVYRMTATGTQAESIYSNYSANGTGFKENGDFVGFSNQSSNWYVNDLDASPQTGFTSGYVASGSPYPTSSYPRHFFGHNTIWYIPSSGYNGHVYAFDISSYTIRYYTGMTGVTTSGYHYMCVSHDVATDKMYVWRTNNANSLIVTELSDSKTTFLAQSGGTGQRSIVSAGTNVTISTGIYTNSTVRARLTPTSDGGVMYWGNDNTIRTLNSQGVETSTSPISTSAVDVGGSVGSVDYYDKTSKILTAAESAAVPGLSAPTFGIQLLGVKSETS